VVWEDGRREAPSYPIGVVFTMIALAMGAPCFFALFGVVFVIFAVFAGVTGRSKALHYAAAHREYQSRRQALLQRIQSRVGQP
jgi:hypothetical protein